jgi:hypothetical protein
MVRWNPSPRQPADHRRLDIMHTAGPLPAARSLQPRRTAPAWRAAGAVVPRRRRQCCWRRRCCSVLRLRPFTWKPRARPWFRRPARAAGEARPDRAARPRAARQLRMRANAWAAARGLRGARSSPHGRMQATHGGWHAHFPALATRFDVALANFGVPKYGAILRRAGTQRAGGRFGARGAAARLKRERMWYGGQQRTPGAAAERVHVAD